MWAILPQAERVENASGPISGSSSERPKLMFRPDRPRMMKQVAVSQCVKR